MTVPVIEIPGIGPKAAEFLRNNGIFTAEDLIKDGINCLQQVPGFGKNRAEQVLKVITATLGLGSKKSSAKPDKKKKKKSKDKNKKHSCKKKSNKDKKKRDKKDKKDKKKGKKEKKKK
jgi:Holliday junction resolvasome RuvABC DNA-binding subunit